MNGYGGAMHHVLRQGKNYDLIIASSGPLSMALPALLARWQAMNDIECVSHEIRELRDSGGVAF